MMSGLIESLVKWGERLVESLGLFGLAVIMFLENVFPPIPSEPFLLGAGFSSADGSLSFPGAIMAATIGSLLGAIIYYYVGVLIPEAKIRSFLRKYGRFALLGEKDLDRALTWFNRHGRLVIFFGRCIPLVRTLISVPAGLTRMPLPLFLVSTAAGTALWSTLLIGVGRALGDNYESALVYFDRFDTVALGAIGVLVVFFVFKRVVAVRRANAPEGIGK
jgi:membrane protein DedA with SNARE-associated domain